MTPPSDSGAADAGNRAEGAALPESPECPFCGKRNTELHSAFGAHASVSTYWCRDCRSPFELMKWRSPRAPGTP